MAPETARIMEKELHFALANLLNKSNDSSVPSSVVLSVASLPTYATNQTRSTYASKPALDGDSSMLSGKSISSFLFNASDELDSEVEYNTHNTNNTQRDPQQDGIWVAPSTTHSTTARGASRDGATATREATSNQPNQRSGPLAAGGTLAMNAQVATATGTNKPSASDSPPTSGAVTDNEIRFPSLPTSKPQTPQTMFAGHRPPSLSLNLRENDDDCSSVDSSTGEHTMESANSLSSGTSFPRPGVSPSRFQKSRNLNITTSKKVYSKYNPLINEGSVERDLPAPEFMNGGTMESMGMVQLPVDPSKSRSRGSPTMTPSGTGGMALQVKQGSGDTHDPQTGRPNALEIEQNEDGINYSYVSANTAQEKRIEGGTYGAYVPNMSNLTGGSLSRGGMTGGGGRGQSGDVRQRSNQVSMNSSTHILMSRATNRWENRGGDAYHKAATHALQLNRGFRVKVGSMRNRTYDS